mgnify:CR=1 FL=1
MNLSTFGAFLVVTTDGYSDFIRWSAIESFSVLDGELYVYGKFEMLEERREYSFIKTDRKEVTERLAELMEDMGRD